MKMYSDRNNIQVELIRLRKKISTKLHISIFNVRQQFMKLGSLLNVRCRHRSVNCEPCKVFFLKFVYFFTKNADSYGIALDGYNERVHRKKQHARFLFESRNPIRYRSITFSFAKRQIQSNIVRRTHSRKFRTQITSAAFLTV